MKEVTGDLFDFDVIAHGCNAVGAMASGIARPFAQRYPLMHYTYRGLCDQGLLNGGDVHPWMENGKYGFNLITQIQPGPNASVLLIGVSLQKAMRLAYRANLKEIAIPLIGCGIGGLSWENDVKHVVENVDGTYGVELTVVKLP